MFQQYFNTIQKIYLSGEGSSEHTYRTALENLLNHFIDQKISRKLNIRHEPVQQGSFGRPDFKVSTDKVLTIGLIETKNIGEDLQKVINSKQLSKYKKLSDNIIITDYLHFLLLKKGEPEFDVHLFSEYQLKKKRFKIEDSRIGELSRLFLNFFSSKPDTIYKTKDLAVNLADKANFLREYCLIDLKNDRSDNRLTGFYKAFKESLLPSLDEKYFADIYSQTITYSLFLAALNCDDPEQDLRKNTAYSYLPGNFPLIREFFHNIDDFPKDIIWSIDEIITILKVTDFYSIKKEFSEYRNQEKGFKDPFIYFYEDFLRHYDPSQRKVKGVYYTPESVVSYIVKSIDRILKDTFSLKEGFLDNDVTVLDFAAGTGTFLLHTFKNAIEQALKYGDKETVNKIINEKLIKNFYGFELLVAPYVIAHLKISEYLRNEGFILDENNRLNIFLTNTLSNKSPKKIELLPKLNEEGKKENEIKNKELLVVMGNPPYSVSSSNKTGFITDEKLEKYKNKVKHEKNIQPLSDDYIKFIRFAHWKMENVKRGVIGIISNNSYIDGLIHRGMREELLKDFDEIYILNLHGNSRLGEKAPDGSKDDNVFDIQQGVCISLFIKKDDKERGLADVYYQDLFGKREQKFEALSNDEIKNGNFNTRNDLKWKKLNPEKEYFFFSDKDFSTKKEYEKGFKINEIFDIYSSGIKTHDDSHLVSYSEFFNNNERYHYKPFDLRNIEYDLKKVERHRNSVMKHMQKDNLGLALMRKIIPGDSFTQVMAVDSLLDINYFAFQSYLFPLYIYNGNKEVKHGYVSEMAIPYGDKNEKDKKDNFTKEFKSFLEIKYNRNYSPEAILGYIYGVLYSPTYRTKYLEFLKIDFPGIIFSDDPKIFDEVSKIGYDLLLHHLMQKSYDNNICKMHGKGKDYSIRTVEYAEDKIFINDERYFAPIPKEIWEFSIGSYQVLEKWLKERKKHKIGLSGEDILQFIKIVNVIDQTIISMQDIDELTKDWI